MVGSACPSRAPHRGGKRSSEKLGGKVELFFFLLRTCRASASVGDLLLYVGLKTKRMEGLVSPISDLNKQRNELRQFSRHETPNVP